MSVVARFRKRSIRSDSNARRRSSSKKYAVLASSPARTLEESAERKLREEIQNEIALPTMEEFLSTRRKALEDEDPDTNP